MYSRILVPIDGSDQAHHGLEVACALAEHYKSKLILLCVTDEDIPKEAALAAIDEGIVREPNYQQFFSTLDHPGITLARAEAKRQLILSRVADGIADLITERGASFAKDQHIAEVLTLVRSGDPGDRIVEVARQHDAELVVIASRGKSGLDALFDPSVADSVRKRVSCPCLVLFPGGES